MKQGSIQLRTSLTVIILTAISAPTLAQDWTRQSPYPADVDLLDVHFITADYGWISGRDDLLMSTNDGGATWRQTSSVRRDPMFSEDPIWDVEFVTDQLGFAFGNAMFRTRDGGATWQDIGFLGSIYDMEWVDEQVGFAIGNIWIARTDDGGDTWSSIWDWQDFNGVGSVDFLDADTGWVTAEINDVVGVFKTTNGGQSFEHISNEALGNIHVIDANTLLATRFAEFYRSTDGGVTWTLQFEDNTQSSRGIWELSRIDVDSFAAIDVHARIWISNDSGVTWTRTQDKIGDWGSEWDIQFPTSRVGYAVGDIGLIFKTTDGGMSWNQISAGAATPFVDMTMNSGGNGVAIGEAIVYTSDFGQTWTVAHDAPNDMVTLQAVDQNTFYAAGGNRFFRSDDGGETWIHVSTTPREVNDISFLNASDGWTCGPFNDLGYSFLRTTDGGETWTILRERAQTRIPIQIQVMPSGRGWSIFPQTEHAITDDGFENSFIPRTLPGGDSWQWFEFADDNIGWYGAFFGGLLKTNNGGFIFQEQTLPGFIRGSGAGTDRLRDIRAMSADEAYVATARTTAIDRGIIYKTINGGASWSPLTHIVDPTNQFGSSLHAIDVLSTGEIWGIAGNGFIWSSGIPDSGLPAELVDLQMITGALLNGGLNELLVSDDGYVHTRSGFGSTLVDLHHMEIVVNAVTTVPAPALIDVMIEDRISEPAGQAQVRLRNRVTNTFDRVGAYALGQADVSHIFAGINAADYIGGGGEIDVSIKHAVFVPFVAFTFESFVDEVRLDVR